MTISDSAEGPVRFVLAQFAARLEAESFTQDTFIALLSQLAAASWQPWDRGPASVVVEAAAAVSGLAEKAPSFLQLCVDCGFLLPADRGAWRFRDAWLHGYLAARGLVHLLAGEYTDRGLTRDRAVSALARIGSPAIPVLISALAVPDDQMGLGAAVALREIGPTAVPALIDAMSAGNDRVRRWVTEALASKDNANSALPALVRVIEQDTRPLVVAGAINALRTSRNRDAEPALIAALQHQDDLVRMFAKEALKEFDSPRARRTLDESIRPAPGRAYYTDTPRDPGPALGDEYENERRVRVSVSSAPRIFISYAKEDVTEADEIRRLLKLADFDPWTDSAELLSGEAWETRLLEAIRTSDFVVALISEHTAGGYQETELRVAVENAPHDRQPVVPFVLPCVTGRLILEDAERAIPGFLDKRHLIKLLDGSWRVLHEVLCASASSAGLPVPLLLRSKPQIDLDEAAVTQMIVGRNFFDSSRNPEGRPAAASLVTFIEGIVTDRATGRQWTSRCSPQLPDVGQSAAMMVSQANNMRLGGTDGWRLPTLEEAMSLMTREKNARGLFISELFSDDGYVLTCDTFLGRGERFVWIASYVHGDCQTVPASGPVPVRLVRTAWTHLR